MDDLLLWVLDIVDKSSAHQSVETGAKLWLEIFDSSLCGVLATEEAVQHFFTHFLTQTLTYKPQLSVSDAISLQNEWTFAKASCCLTTLFRKLAVVFSVGQLLGHLQRVLETHEVNWKHVLCFLSTLLVYEQSAQSSLKELLSRLLNSAFQGYDLENMITAFLLARQGALEGPAIFLSYSDWFKMSFGSSSGYHANSKKSLVFLLKFLSDLVPFEPPQYLKVHILNPPYVPVKHRSLLMEYVSLAKTRLADLKESVEDMGLYEDVSGAAVQPECQAEQDVEKAVSLFRTTGRISATVMEASIFRRPYFLTRFLPALLKPRLLPVKQDDLMSFIEALKKADKIPAALYSSYLESCQKQRQQKSCFVLNEFHLQAVNILLRNFCQCLLNASRSNSPNQQNQWASMFVRMLLGNTQLLSSLMNRLWDLFHNQGSLLNSAHVLGLAVFVVHLQASMSHNPLVQLASTVRQEPIPFRNVLSSALVCSTLPNMLFCVRQVARPSICLFIFFFGHQKGLVLKNVDLQICFYPFLMQSFCPDFQGFGRYIYLHKIEITADFFFQSFLRSQEYQQWACMDFYLPLPEEQGGCGGDMKNLCSHFLNAIMDQQLRCHRSNHSWIYQTLFSVKADHGEGGNYSCLLHLQRRACAPAGLLPSHITAHFLKGLIYACVQCKHPAEELSKVWSHIGLHCPLMLVSTAHWWRRLSAFAFSLWRRLSDGASPPQQLQLLTDCQHWASSLVNGQGVPMPSAPSILLAASLHRSWQSCEVKSLRVALNSLQHQKDAKYKQVRANLSLLEKCDAGFL
uniref:Fanconi anemia group A protein n=1 Tax=Oryzias sinensis TaxID=183150 RepID=A0A8C7ZJ22_9TELE